MSTAKESVRRTEAPTLKELKGKKYPCGLTGVKTVKSCKKALENAVKSKGHVNG